MASIARRYAQALLEALRTSEEYEQAEEQLTLLRRVVVEVPSFARLLIHPGINAAKKKALLDGVFGTAAGLPSVRRFAEILVEKRRIGSIPAITDAFRKLKDRRLGLSSIEVVAAAAVAQGEKASWESALAKLAGGRVRIDYRTDTSLIGGATARIGSVVYDGSVRGSLERIRQSLLGE